MSEIRLQLRGFEELRAELRNMPAALAGEASHIVEGAANGAASEIKQGYGAHVFSGNLRDHVVVTHGQAGAFGSVSRVKSTAKHAYLFENGSQARHTDSGANRGAMPPFHVFIPAAIRARKLMTDQLINLVQRAGLTVTGNG